MEAKHDFGCRRFFDPQALRADGHATIAADVDGCSDAPHIIPPRAAGCWPQDGAFFFTGLIPRPLRGLAEFAMNFMFVAMSSEVIDLGIGDFDFGDLFAGEVGGESALPVLVGAFDFAFGLGRGGIEETDVIELECPAQLGEGVGIVSEEDAVVIRRRFGAGIRGPEKRRAGSPSRRGGVRVRKSLSL